MVSTGCGRRAALWVLAALLSHAHAELRAQAVGEYEVKAAFLYNFAGFIQWPDAGPVTPTCIAIVGRDPFGVTLDDQGRGKTINGRPLEIKRSKGEKNAPACPIVFISGSEKKRLASILESLDGRPVLTVADMPGFCEHGGMVDFVTAEHRVQFRINLHATQKAGLQVSSKLLSLAQTVWTPNP